MRIIIVIPIAVTLSLIVIYWLRSRRKHRDALALRFVRIINPVLPDERGRQLLIGIVEGRCRVALRNGEVRNYEREEIENAE